ncbi:MAG: LysR family transcriptional regulator [Leptospiraceae bacterium]|nr:LysR family transcriptional regulator [Leptospiraceae bacterium]
MEFKQIRTFLEIAEAGTFQKAAQSLGLSQPALSRQIFLLEKELKVKLMMRGPKSIRLTKEGEKLLIYSKRLKDLWEEILEAMNENGSNISGSYSISAGGTVSAWILPKILIQIKNKFPNVKLSVREGDNLETRESLIQGDVDLAILTSPVSIPGIVARGFLRDKILPVVPRNHFLLQNRKNVFKYLEKESFIFYHPASSMQIIINKKLKSLRRNFKPSVGMELRSVESVVKSIEAGLGIGFLSKFSIPNSLAALAIPELEMERSFEICHRKNPRVGISLLTDEIIQITNSLYK